MTDDSLSIKCRLSSEVMECCARSGPNAYNPESMMGGSVQSNKPRAPRYTISSRSAHGGYMVDTSELVVHCSLHTLSP